MRHGRDIVVPRKAVISSCVALLLLGRAASAEVAIADTPERLHTAAQNVLVVVLQDSAVLSAEGQGPGGATSFAVDLTPASWTVTDNSDVVSVTGLHRYSITYDEDMATGGNQFPITVRHRIYLVLGQNLQEGHTYAVTTPYGAVSTVFSPTTTWCESIHVNQVGYNERATSRFANFGVFMGSGGTIQLAAPPAFDVLRLSDSAVMISGRSANAGVNDTAATPSSQVYSGEWVYRLPLGDLPAGGPYLISVRGVGRSHPFGVGDAYSRELTKVVVRGLYHQRCGLALQQPFTSYTRPICHTVMYDVRANVNDHPMPVPIPPGTPALESFAGGYHDAGDFDRRPMHTIIPLLMLGTYEAFPLHFLDGQYDIPESGNGIPDFLDEALWGLKLWENLQITNPSDPYYGAVRPGTGDAHPQFGVSIASTDPWDNATYQVSDSHANVNMGNNLGPNVTALAVGMFAQASRLVRPYDAARADSLLGRARLGWASLARRFPELDDVSNPVVLKTRYMYAGLQLFLATGEQKYHDLFKAGANAIVVSTGIWPEQYLPGNIDASCQTAHFISYLLPQPRTDLDQTLINQLRSRILWFAEHGTYMGPPPEGEPYPRGATRFYAWGSATAQGRYADVYAFATLFATPDRKQTYYNAVSQYADYALGLNPLGISYFTGLQEYFHVLGGSFAALDIAQPQSPCHADSYFTNHGKGEHTGNPIGNVPGILIYGPVASGSGAPYQCVVSNQVVPQIATLPPERRWGDGWSLINSNEFTTWETMAWAVTMHGFLYDASGTALRITSPNGSEAWRVGESRNITWSVQGYGGTLIIELVQNDVTVWTIANDVPAAAGFYQWTVGRLSDGSKVSGDSFKVRIRSTSAGGPAAEGRLASPRKR